MEQTPHKSGGGGNLKISKVPFPFIILQKYVSVWVAAWLPERQYSIYICNRDEVYQQVNGKLIQDLTDLIGIRVCWKSRFSTPNILQEPLKKMNIITGNKKLLWP